jgi:hypothetical protein
MNESEIDLDNLPLVEALRFAHEGSTTGGLLTHAALKTLAAGCRELTAARAEIEAVTEQRDEIHKDFMCLAELLDGHDATECRMNLVRLKEQRDRLAELLSSLLPYMNPLIANDAHNQAQSILQSLTTNEQ